MADDPGSAADELDPSLFLAQNNDLDDDLDEDDVAAVTVEPELYLEPSIQLMEEDDDDDDANNQAQHHFLQPNLTDDDSNSRLSASNSSTKTARAALGNECPICGQTLHKQHSRDHVAWHFMDELKELMAAAGVTQQPTDRASGLACPEMNCLYRGDRVDSVAKHLALFHNKLDEFLDDPGLVEAKRAIARNKPQKVDIGNQCCICDMADPSREHVARHFMKELMEIVSELEDQTSCPLCSYKGDKPQNLGRHIALVHSKLDELLSNTELVAARRAELMSKPTKVFIGSTCPICDQPISKQHARVHVIWHFMDDLREMAAGFSNPNACEYCDYKNPNTNKVAKHLALGHSMLDRLLQDEQLCAEKRAVAATKPKKENVGPVCPVCGIREPTREHVARHFGDELLVHVQSLPSQTDCSECNYRGDKPKTLGIHIALVHGLLDLFLKDKALVNSKRSVVKSTPKKVAIGKQCPICGMNFQKSQNRDHVAWHYMDELREIVNTFPNPLECNQCSYVTDKPDNLVKHIALGHSKLDELMQDEELMASKRAKAMSKPKKVAIGKCCPVCGAPDPAREHVARHFSDELIAMIDHKGELDPCKCPECDYKGDRERTLGIHMGLVHGNLDRLLLDESLVNDKRLVFESKPKKLSIGPTCPVCDMQFVKSQNRDHVSWHFMDELKIIVQEFPDPTKCTQCPYEGDSLEKMVKHIALGHSMLDGFLQDEELVQEKRMKALAKPKKVDIGRTCPICNVADPSREHVARHLTDELMDIVYGFDNENQCPECSYNNMKPKNVAIHIALAHNMLDHLLTNEELIQKKRDIVLSKPQKVDLKGECPVCGLKFTKGTNRDHVAWHFMDDLREIVNAFPDPTACPDCTYTSDKVDNVMRHIGLGHSKLDEFLQDEELVERKRQEHLAKPKKVAIGPCCPVCGQSFKKNNQRDHTAWHFMDELRAYVASTKSEKACTMCYYTTDKLDNLAKHYALGHSMLDEYIQDEALMARKKSEVAKKPKRLSFGKDCPLCERQGVDRDHIARHFMPELQELVSTLPNRRKCDQCDYTNSKVEYMAKHMALFHCKLDEFMQDEALVRAKKEKCRKIPKKVSMGQNCPFCLMAVPSRDHVVKHFLEDLLALVREKSASPLSCHECEFTSDKAENVARHVGLMHSRMDEFLQDEEFMKAKVAAYTGPMMQDRETVEAFAAAAASGSRAKVLPVRESVRKSRRQKDIEERAAHNEAAAKLTEQRIKEEEQRRIAEMASTTRITKLSSNTHTMMSLPPSISLTPKMEPMDQMESSPVATPPKPAVQALLPAGTSLTKKRVAAQELWAANNGTPPSSKKPKWCNRLLNNAPTNNVVAPVIEDPENDHLEIDMGMMVPEVSHSVIDDEDAVVGAEEFNPADFLLQEEDDDDAANAAAANIVTADDSEEPMLIEPQIEFNDDDEDDGEELGEDEDDDDDDLFPKCPVCGVTKGATREHVSRHFLPELHEVVAAMAKPLQCSECPFQATSLEETGLHLAIVHMYLEKYLQDHELIAHKRASVIRARVKQEPGRAEATMRKTSVMPVVKSEPLVDDKAGIAMPQYMSPAPVKTQKMSMGANCVVCGFSQPQREHVARHFMDELLAYVHELEDHHQCSECPYRGEKPQNLAKHFALAHGMLDQLLANTELVQEKHAAFLAKPKKVSLGPNCMVCDAAVPKKDIRNHTIWHFMDDLKEMVYDFPDVQTCPLCNYVNVRPDKMAKHLALGHSKLDELLMNAELVAAKRANLNNKPKKIDIGCECRICGLKFTKGQNRDHVSWHFMDELREYVSTFPDPKSCPFCTYVTDKSDNLVKHVACGHYKVDELLQNEELVQEKIRVVQSKKRKITIGKTCPICDMTFSKSQNRDHVAWHFMDEMREIISSYPDPTQCVECDYTSPKLDNHCKHLALGHSKLDDFLMDEDLCAAKRAKELSKPKKYALGDTCPICDQQNPSREHVARHFLDELLSLAEDPRKLSCHECDYKGKESEYLGKHLGLFHMRMDTMLYDAELVARKRADYAGRQQQLASSAERVCAVCDVSMNKSKYREHAAKHFTDEILAVIATFEKPNVCDLCEVRPARKYRNARKENMVRHVALAHGKLDEFLLDDELVAAKRAEMLQ